MEGILHKRFDAGVQRGSFCLEVSNGIVRFAFESCSFESLEVKNFQDISIQNDGTNVGLVNDHRFYNMSHTECNSLFYASYGDYNVASGIMRGLNGPTFLIV